MTTVYIFYGTLAGMLGMISVKMYEAKRRRRSFIYNIFVRFDEATHGMLARIFGIGRARVDAFEQLVKVDIKKNVYLTVVTFIAHGRGLYDKMRASTRGVVKLRANPKVSAFLRDIEEAKKEIGARADTTIE